MAGVTGAPRYPNVNSSPHPCRNAHPHHAGEPHSFITPQITPEYDKIPASIVVVTETIP